jgi:hypothetical protein
LRRLAANVANPRSNGAPIHAAEGTSLTGGLSCSGR